MATPLSIRIVTPAGVGSHQGNRVTALRWARLLRELGHRVAVTGEYRDQPCDLLVALHARKSHPSVERFRARYGERPLVVALTGTDLYQDLPGGGAALRSLALASRLVVLQPLARAALPEEMRPKARTIYQSLAPPPGLPSRRPSGRDGGFEVCVLAHLRAVKDPLRTARAARLLPAGSRLRVVHVGGALDPALAAEAGAEMAANPRYRWLGELERRRALGVLARSQLLALTSRLEGGANAVSEAVVLGVPVVSSRIDGSIGLLGADYPGYFPVGDTAALAELLGRAETDPAFHSMLRERVIERAPLFTRARERASWRELIGELLPDGARHPAMRSKRERLP